MLLTYLLGGLRIRLLVSYSGETIRLASAIKAHILGLFSAAMTPSGSGHAPMIALSLQTSGLSASKAWSISLYSNVIDMLCYAWMLILALSYLIAEHSSLDRRIMLIAGIVSIILFSFFYLSSYKAGYLKTLAHILFSKRVLKHWYKPAMRFVSRLSNNLNQLGHQKFLQQLYLQIISSLMHVAGFAIFYVSLRAVDLPVSFWNTVAMIFLVLLLGFIVPTPGGSGYAETAGVFIVGQDYDINLVLTAVLLWRLISHYSNFIVGPLLGGYNLRKKLKS